MERNIQAQSTVRASVDQAHKVFVADPGSLLAESVSPDERIRREFATSLATSSGSGASVQHGVTVAIGMPVSRGTGFITPFEWHPAGHARLLPSFSGVITVDVAGLQSSIELVGTYQAPLGPAGRFGDSLIGHRIASQTLQSLLERIALRLDAVVDQRRSVRPWGPAPVAPDLRDDVHSEHYIG